MLGVAGWNGSHRSPLGTGRLAQAVFIMRAEVQRSKYFPNL